MKDNLVVLIIQVTTYGILFCFLVKGQTASDRVDAQTTSTCMESSDFEQVVKMTTFVDKTQLIKDIFLSAKVNLVTAPRKFGKSTNLDMIKRFLEIDIDENGHPRNITKTLNYKLFKENNLDIYKDKQFFNENFGKHPVIFIDFSSLRVIDSYTNFIKKFKKVVLNTFGYHAYLVKNKTLWKDEAEKDMFVRYIVRPWSKKLIKEKLPLAFKWLSKLLHNHFSKKVFVLIDESDSFAYSLIFKDSSDLGKISRFLLKVEEALLISNEYINMGLLTGVLRTYRGNAADHIYDYHFLEDYQFSLYSGLTENNLDILLAQMITDDKKRKETKLSVNKFYGGYRIYNKTGAFTNVYCIYSVIYFITHGKFITNYLCEPDYFDSFKHMFTNQKVREEVDTLLSGREVHLDLREPFYKEDILELHNIVKSGNGTHDVRWGTFSKFLFSFGYLTTTQENKGFSIGKFKLPNKEIFEELNSYIIK